MGWLRRFFRVKDDRPIERARRIHNAIVRKARQQHLYSEGLIADDMEGRFHAVSLYAAIVIPALEAAGPDGPSVAEALNAVIFDSFDAALRETGVGDASIARKIRKMGEEYVGLGRAVNEALRSEGREASLVDVITRNGVAEGDRSVRLAQILIGDDTSLNMVAPTDILAGRLPW